MAVLTLLTDFGVEDYYVAAVKGTVLRLAPGTQIVDVSNQVPGGDLVTGAYLLAAAVPWFPDGTVHLAVVDPGVGSARRILVASLTSTGGSSWIVLPDNGLLTHLLHQEAIQSVRSVEKTDLFLDNPGQTFHGRDRFAPVAAWLLRGESAEELGPEVGDPVRLPWEGPRREPGLLAGKVVHVDRYGNLITDIPAGWLPGETCRAEVAGHRVHRRASHYAEIPDGEPAMIPGSLGTVELSLKGEDLARRWIVERGTEVRITWRMS
jgi:S-adenosylmethionine hydrolase